MYLMMCTYRMMCTFGCLSPRVRTSGSAMQPTLAATWSPKLLAMARPGASPDFSQTCPERVGAVCSTECRGARAQLTFLSNALVSREREK